MLRKVPIHDAKLCIVKHIVFCDTALMAVCKALNATYLQTIPQALDNPSQATPHVVPDQKKEPGALSGVSWGKGKEESGTGLLLYVYRTYLH